MVGQKCQFAVIFLSQFFCHSLFVFHPWHCHAIRGFKSVSLSRHFVAIGINATGTNSSFISRSFAVGCDL